VDFFKKRVESRAVLLLPLEAGGNANRSSYTGVVISSLP
jgi:hypothetical protein